MKFRLKWLMLPLSMMVATAGWAEGGGDWSARFGVLAGTLSGEYSTPSFGTNNDANNYYGVGVGATYQAGASSAFVDYWTEYSLGDEDFNRTEHQLTFGHLLGDASVFVGYRLGKFGDDVGYSSDDSGTGFGNSEQGPFIGGGYSFRFGSRFALVASLAYTVFDAEFECDCASFESDGVSVRISANLLTNPGHSLFLHVRRFTGDDAEFFPPADTTSYTETYAFLGYLLSI